jgi:hypothetical protein
MLTHQVELGIILLVMRLPITHIISLLLIALILCGSAVSLCHDLHLSEKAICTHAPQDLVKKSTSEPCPSCPDADHSETHHCTSVCDCCSHLQVNTTALQLFYAPIVSNLSHQEILKSPRDIYLSIFVPPDSLA